MDRVLFSSRETAWETPQELFDQLDREFEFELDVCALPENAKCGRFYTPEDDGLSQPWPGVVWCNPPYGREVGRWVEKAFAESAGGVRLSFSCRHGRIPGGSTDGFTNGRRCGSCVVGLNSAGVKTAHRFRAWL